MKPRTFTLLVTSAKVSFWISLPPVVFILASLTGLQLFTEVSEYLLEGTGMPLVLAALFLTAILTTVIAITLEVPTWISLSLLLSTLLFSTHFLWANILPLTGANRVQRIQKIPSSNAFEEGINSKESKTRIYLNRCR